MCTPLALFSHLFNQICLFVLCLYTVGRLITLPCEISIQAPVIMRQQSLVSREQSKVCVRKVNRIMRFRDMAV